MRLSVLIMSAMLLTSTSVFAKPSESSMYSYNGFEDSGSVAEPRQKIKSNSKKSYKRNNNRNYESSTASVGPRPDKWCGWFMRTIFGGGPEYNLARNWENRGRPSGPQVGAVVVWPHHVGVITGKSSDGQWIVKSGNDSNAVRERPRSVAGAIAFRVL